jgi:hypothetical protein
VTPIATYPAQTPAQAAQVGYAAKSSNQAGIGATETDITELTVTITVPAGRQIKLTAGALLDASVVNDFYAPRIKEGTTVLQVAVVQITVIGQGLPWQQSVVISPSAGTHTYKVTMQRIGGTGTGSFLANPSNNPAFLLAEDITGQAGPAGAPSVPVGMLAQATSPNSVNGITTAVTLLTVNVTVPAGRQLKITAGANIIINGAARVLGSINMDGTSVGRWIDRTMPSASGYSSASDVALVSPSAGSHAITMDIAALSSSVNVEAGPTEPIHLVVEDVTPTPAPASTAPSSVLAYVSSTTTQSAISTETDVTGLTATVTVPAGRRIRLVGRIEVGSPSVNNNCFLLVRETTAASAEVGRASAVVNTSTEATLSAESILTPSAGTHTYKCTLQTNAGTVGTTNIGNAPNYLLIEDVTGVSIPASNYVTATPVDATGSVDAEGVSAAAARADHLHRGGIAPVTSATRPASPYNEQFIGETDTGLLKYWNGSNWVTNNNLKWFGNGQVMAGSAPAVDTGSVQFKMQGGTIVAVTDASGYFTVTYPVAFPNGVFVVLLTPQYDFGPFFAYCLDSAVTVTSFKARAWNVAGTPYNTATLRFAWLAYGW